MKLRSLMCVMVAAAWPVSAVLAAGGDGGGATEQNTPAPQVVEAENLIKAEQFALAIQVLEKYLARARNDASAENWLGYSYRKTGQLEPAFVHYEKALKINPKHRGAHEYIGEAYLMAGKPDKAEEHLKILVRLCGFGQCEERDDLKAALAAYRAKNAPVTSSR